MKFLVVLSVALACVAADVSHIVGDEAKAPIVKSFYEVFPDGAYQYLVETGNGINAQAQGSVKNPNSEYPSSEVKGAYSYPSPDGTRVEVAYTADETGFHPTGSHLPVGPAIPEAILRSLEWISAHPAPEPSKRV